MLPVMRRLRAAAVLGLLVGAFWMGFFILLIAGFAMIQDHSVLVLWRALSVLAPYVLGVSVALGLIFTASLYLWRPKMEVFRLSARRAGLIGALSTFAGYLALDVATGLRGVSAWLWIARIVFAGGLSVVGAAAGVALQRTAYRRTLIDGERKGRGIAA